MSRPLKTLTKLWAANVDSLYYVMGEAAEMSGEEYVESIYSGCPESLLENWAVQANRCGSYFVAMTTGR